MFHTKILEKIRTHLCSVFSFSESGYVNEIMRKNIVEPDRPQMKCNKVHALRLQTHLEYVTIIAFPRQ